MLRGDEGNGENAACISINQPGMAKLGEGVSTWVCGGVLKLYQAQAINAGAEVVKATPWRSLQESLIKRWRTLGRKVLLPLQY